MICLKKVIFAHFLYFRKSSAAHTKIIAWGLFHVNMFDQTHYSLVTPYSKDIYLKTGVHFWFYREILRSLKWHMLQINITVTS